MDRGPPLYRDVLALELPWLDGVVSAKPSRRLPVVLTPREVRALLLQMSGATGLVASLLYGTGMRLLEALRLRVNDIELERRELRPRAIAPRCLPTIAPPTRSPPA